MGSLALVLERRSDVHLACALPGQLTGLDMLLATPGVVRYLSNEAIK